MGGHGYSSLSVFTRGRAAASGYSSLFVCLLPEAVPRPAGIVVC